jgi:hypothetical protein
VLSSTSERFEITLRNPATSIVSASLTLALAIGPIQLAPTLAHAQEPAAEAAPAEDPQLAEAKRLYDEGEVKFQLAKYQEALVLWERAYEILMLNREANRAILNALVYNIAEAHSRAYDLSRNPTHLRTAKQLLVDYRTSHRELYGDDPEAVKERSEADDRITELDAKIADSEAKGEVGTPLATGTTTTTTGPTPPPENLTPMQQWDRELKADPTWVKGSKQVGGGAVLVSIGSIFTLVSLGFVVWGVGLRTGTDDLGLDGTGAFITGGVFGVIGVGMLVPGAIVLSKGVKNRKAALAAHPKPTARLLPSFDPRRGQAGLTFTLRF